MTSLLASLGQKQNHIVSDKEKSPKRRFLKALAQGRFTEAEVILTSNPALQSVLMHLPGLRHTAFFKNAIKRRISFYRDYARANDMVSGLSDDDKQELRNQFAMSHCKTRAIRDAAQRLISEYEQLKRMQRLKKIRRKRRKRGLFL